MRKYLLTFLFFCLLFIVGCATVPSYRVPQPWIRSLKSNQQIDPTKSIKIEVAGVTSPLLGNEQLTSEKLRSTLTQLIKRRGFTLATGDYDYLVKLSYKTDRADKMKLSSSISTANTHSSMVSLKTGAGATSGLGVSVARAIGLLSSSSSTVAAQSIEQVLSYTHTISIEICGRDGGLLWKGESTWDSEELNLINRIVPALQLILSDLPSDKSVRPEIPEVKGTHVKNYYRLECYDFWFTCPALPYKIIFSDNNSRGSIDKLIPISIPSGVSDLKAFAGYVDLIQTAEYALPNEDEKNWEDPLKVSLWEEVTLGGQYLLGPQKTPVNILVKLSGKSEGYYIQECKIATDDEYAEYSKKLDSWRKVLSNYYDVYK